MPDSPQDAVKQHIIETLNASLPSIGKEAAIITLIEALDEFVNHNDQNEMSVLDNAFFDYFGVE